MYNYFLPATGYMSSQQNGAGHLVFSAQLDFRLRMPHKPDTETGREGPVGQSIPTAVGVPVKVAGIHTAIAVNFLNNGNVPEVTCTFHPRFQHHNRWPLKIRLA